MFKFEHKSSDNTKITLETEAVCLTDILEEFQMFLKGCGFGFDGDIVIEDLEDFIDPISANDYLEDGDYQINLEEVDQEMVDLVKELSHD